MQAILDAMAWLGLDYDEGPYYQMQRMDRYRAVIDDMLARGLAYRDYMTPAELDALRDGADGARREAALRRPLAAGERATGRTPPAGVAPVIRFRNPDDGSVAWDDGVKGRIEIANAELDDLVIARSDGTPTYNFCVVVDDCDMRITHVIRGDDHVNNTPRQINILRALGADAAGVCARADGARRRTARSCPSATARVGVMEYEATGYLPEAMVNFLARLGWAHGDDEIFSRAQLVEWFDLDGHQLGAVALRPEQAQLGQPGAHEAHAGRASSARRSRRSWRGPASIPPRGPDPGAVAACCCAIAPRRWSRWPTRPLLLRDAAASTGRQVARADRRCRSALRWSSCTASSRRSTGRARRWRPR